MNWIYRINIVAPIEKVSLLNADWTMIAPGEEDDANTFGASLLSMNGQAPATHTVISTAASEEMRQAIENIFADDLTDCVVSVQGYQDNNADSLIASLGLKRIEVKL